MRLRSRPATPAPPPARSAAVCGDGGILRPRGPVGPPDDVRHRVGPGLRGCRRRRRQPVRVPLTLADAARYRAGAGGRVRQLPAAGRQADRLAFGPAAGVVQHGSGADPGSRAGRVWLRDGGSGTLRAPTAEDLDYHLSTLFPPVRPHGHMELRMIDAQPGDGWIVPAAVVTALTDDGRAADDALAAAEPVWEGSPDAGDPWLRAARCGPADPVIARASRQCFETAEAALMRSGAPTEIRPAVSE